MKKLLLAVLTVLTATYVHAQTLTVDANGSLNLPKLVAQTTAGQIFFTGHQLGNTYSYPLGIFTAATDNPNGLQNYYYHGITNNVANFYVRADGQGYFAGNVMVGTTVPSSLLTLNSDPGASIMMQKGGSNIAALSVNNTSCTWNGAGGIGLIVAATNADISLQTGNTTATSLIVKNNGNVGIGTTQPNQKLTVAGTVHATEVLVDQNIPQPDYVFEKDYDLASLKDVKTYIDKNHHLPEIPSAAQVAKEGINLGEMNAKLLKKIEELTLYLIEKDEQFKNQNRVNMELRTNIELLEKKLEGLTKNK